MRKVWDSVILVIIDVLILALAVYFTDAFLWGGFVGMVALTAFYIKGY